MLTLNITEAQICSCLLSLIPSGTPDMSAFPGVCTNDNPLLNRDGELNHDRRQWLEVPVC